MTYTPSRRTVTMALGAALVSACGRRGPASNQAAAAPGSIPRSQIVRADFGDDDPVEWPGHPPSRYPVHGVDVSRYQGDIDWRALRGAGANFAFLKATEGGDRVDSAFARNWSGTAAAGVARAAYHFFYFCTPAEVQARWFIANVPRTAGSLPPVLDLEWNDFSPTCTARPAPATVRSEARRFVQILTGHYGQRPIIYTTPAFYGTNRVDQLGGEVWVRAVTEHPAQAYPGQPWTFWQYSGTGRAPGVRGRIDLNTFNGSGNRWHQWRTTRSIM